MATNDIDMPDSADVNHSDQEPLMEPVEETADADMNGEEPQIISATGLISLYNNLIG